uniref:Thymus, brain and testes associated n=1 Tax=Pipistrellus kuhlii TaxID=59472 RepID=A0A7J7VCL6_PIPKU|nr:thymus, brain and testes associated [Pipistrellus kuhlii]
MSMEVKIQPAEQPLASPKAEPKAEKSEHKPRSQGVEGPQRGAVVPGVVDFKVVYEKLRPAKPETPGTYRFGRLSHNSFFSRHHPHPHRVTHIKDFMGKPVCVVKDQLSLASLPQTAPFSPSLMKMPTLFVPIGDPQSNRDPQLSSEAWKKELKNLASQVVIYTKEKEPENKEEEVPKREQGAKYSAETGRLIPASSRALSTRHSRQGRGSHPSNRDGVQTYILQNAELLILELLCQILQTDSLSAIQFWLLYSPPKEKALALGLLQTAVAQLLPQGLDSIPTEKLLSQLQDIQEPPSETQQPNYSLSPRKSKTPPLPKSETPEYIGKAQVLRVHPSQSSEEKVVKAEC